MDRGGNVGVIFGLSLLPVAAFAGAAVDFGRAVELQTFSRSMADSAALAIAAADTNVASSTLERVRAALLAKYGEKNLADLSVAGSWIDSGNYKIDVRASLQAFILPAVPGMPEKIAVAAESVVNRIPPKYETLPPTLSQLSPEAADYNRISIYCYDPRRKTDADKGRRAVTAIADNGTPGLDYSTNVLPTCTEGEYISYKLRNVRNARAYPSRWDATRQDVYEYYTDTTVDPNTGVHVNHMSGAQVSQAGSSAAINRPLDMVNNPILETILCDTASQCKPRSEGGILPNNHEINRTPATASRACSDGKFMYFGWEDRPPNAGSDRDYDDIRVIVNCPKVVKVQDKQVKIVR